MNEKTVFKNICLLVLALLISIMLMLNAYIQAEELANEVKELEQKIEQLKQEQEETSAIIEEAKQKFEPVSVKSEPEQAGEIFTITGYAPLDPDAVEGVCYQGNPNETYSGKPPVPGKTAAGHISLIGKTVFVEGMGFRRINDIGGAIGEKDLDLVFETRAEALDWGRQERRVVILDGQSLPFLQMGK